MKIPRRCHSALVGAFLVVATAAIACGAGPPPMPSAPPPASSPQPTAQGYSPDGFETVAESAPASSRSRRARSESTASGRDSAPMVATGSAPASQGAVPDGEPPVADEPSPRGQQLIYTGAVVLAIYDVAATQRKAIEIVEARGGYVAERSSTKLTARVPAPRFREVLDEFTELGDLLDKSWRAQDVTEEMRDLDIRLRNSLELRNRLEVLLEQAESIEEALQIEKELERITLEIERIRGTLLNLEDRVAYSTIDLRFQAIQLPKVPDDEFLLPFSWLYTLGLESLLQTPGRFR